MGAQRHRDVSEGTRCPLGRPEASVVVYELQHNAFSRFDVESRPTAVRTWTGVDRRDLGHPVPGRGLAANRRTSTSPSRTRSATASWCRTDAASTWTRYAVDGAVTTVAPDPRHAKALWLGGPDGLFRSTDGGRARPASGAADQLDRGRTRRGDAPGRGGRLDRDQPRRRSAFRGGTTPPGRMRVSALTFGRQRRHLRGCPGLRRPGPAVGGRGVLCSGNGGRAWHDVSGDSRSARSAAWRSPRRSVVVRRVSRPGGVPDRGAVRAPLTRPRRRVAAAR
jgi:hypothetical protein